MALPVAFLVLPSVSPAAQSLVRPIPARMSHASLKAFDLEGREWNTAALRGRAVLLNFWAGWCESCLDELSYLNKLAAGDGTKSGLVILGVNYKESDEDIHRFLARRPLAYPVLRDKNGELFKAWTDGVLPTTILFDRAGRPRWRVIGAIDPSDPGFQSALAAATAAGKEPTGSVPSRRRAGK